MSNIINNPLVSVLMPTYNHAPYIAQAIEGTLMQKTNFDFEILIGEDDSADGTRELCQEYTAKCPDKIRLFLNDRKNVVYINGRPTGRWNFINLLKNSNGKYIAICEGDDFWTNPYKLQKQVDFLEANPEYAISFHNAIVEFYDPYKKEMLYSDFCWNRIEWSRDIYTIQDLIASPLCPTASVVFKRPKDFIIPDWYLKVPSGDMALLMLVCDDFKIKYFNENWSVYRKHKGGITVNHKGDYIHAGRIYMYLRMLEHYNGRYADSITKIIQYHLDYLISLSCLSDEDQQKLFSLIPDGFKNKEKKLETSRKRPVKITFVAYGPNQINGPNIWLQRILPELSQRGFKTQVIFLMSSNESCAVLNNLRSQGIYCITLPYKQFTEQSIVQLLVAVKADTPDVFVPNLSVPAYYASRWIKEVGIPTIGILHSDDKFHHELIENFVTGIENYRLSGIVSVSAFIEALVRAKKPSNVESLKCSYGITLPMDFATEPTDRLNLVYTGRLIQHQKRIFDVISSLKKVVNNISGTYATLYGNDREGGKVIETINNYNLGERLKYGGLLSYKEIFPTLIQHHVFVLLSDFEGMSISLLEAMGCGLVPICTKTRSGALEIIKHNENGLLVENRKEDFYDAVNRLKNEKGLWSRLSRAARETIKEEYTIEICANRWAEFIDALILKSPEKSEIAVPEIKSINLPTLMISENGIAREDNRFPGLLIAQQNKNSNDKYLNISLTPENMDLFYVRASIKTAIESNLHNFKGIFLDVGCGEMPYREYLINNSEITQYIGLDIDNPAYQKKIKPDLYWDGKFINLCDNSVDCAFATEVFEHLPEIETVLTEIYRVIKPEGRIFFTLPFLWPLHDVPNDEYRYTPYSLRRYLNRAGFVNIDINPLGGWNASLAQMIGLWINRSGLPKRDRRKYAKQFFPFYRALIESDRATSDFTSQAMFTGLYGTASKKFNINYHPSQSSIDSTCQGNISVLSDESNIMSVQGDYCLAIFTPCVGATSETFITNHIRYLLPGKTVVVTGKVEDGSWLKSPLKCIPFADTPSRYKPEIEKGVLDFLKHHRATHILCEYGCTGSEIVILNQQLTHLPIFVHFHGYDASQELRKPMIVKYYRWMGDNVTGIITDTMIQKKRLVEIGVPKGKIHIIPYGVKIPGIQSDSKASPCRFICVSRLVPKKAPIYLLKAFRNAHKIHPLITLDIVGDGPLMTEVKSFIAKENLRSSVRIHGARSNDYVKSLMCESSVYVQHSVTDPVSGDAEGLPVAILEAAAAGLPVISTIHEGIPDEVEHGVTGFLVKEFDVDTMATHMTNLAGNNELRNSMGIAARKKIQKSFTLEHEMNSLRTLMGLSDSRADSSRLQRDRGLQMIQ